MISVVVALLALTDVTELGPRLQRLINVGESHAKIAYGVEAGRIRRPHSSSPKYLNGFASNLGKLISNGGHNIARIEIVGLSENSGFNETDHIIRGKQAAPLWERRQESIACTLNRISYPVIATCIDYVQIGRNFIFIGRFETDSGVEQMASKVHFDVSCWRISDIVNDDFDTDFKSVLNQSNSLNTDRQVEPRTLGKNGGISAALSMISGAPRESRRSDSGGEGGGAHSKLPPNRRSLFVRISGLIDRRLSADTVTGNGYAATGVTLFLCLFGGWGVWRLWNGRWLTGGLLVAVLLIGGPTLFALP
jgi:hypothetical protein